MVSVMLPPSPDASTNGLNVMVPNTRSAQMSPLLAANASSHCWVSTYAVVITGLVGAPAEPYGPMSAGTDTQAPYGTSGSDNEASTVFFEICFANRSGDTVPPTL